MAQLTIFCKLLVLLAVWLPAAALAGAISGKVTKANGKPLKNARIMAWDKDITSNDDFLGTARTNRYGRFTLQYPNKRWDGLKKGPNVKSNNPDIYLTIDIKLRGRWERVAKTRVYKDHSMKKHLRLRVTGINYGSTMVRRTIYGRVRTRSGRPVVGAIIKAWDKDWGKKAEFMGKARTNRRGYYRIHYLDRRWDGLKNTPRLGKGSYPDVFITIQHRRAKRPAATSAIYHDHDPKRKLKIDMRLRRWP